MKHAAALIHPFTHPFLRVRTLHKVLDELTVSVLSGLSVLSFFSVLVCWPCARRGRHGGVCGVCERSCLLIKGGIGKFVGKLEKFAGLFSAIVHGPAPCPWPPPCSPLPPALRSRSPPSIFSLLSPRGCSLPFSSPLPFHHRFNPLPRLGLCKRTPCLRAYVPTCN